MSSFDFGNLDKWADKVKNKHSRVLRDAIGQMFADLEVVPGITLGGSRVQGTIPYFTTDLAESLESSLEGAKSVSQRGRGSYVPVMRNIQGGDIATFYWGNETVDYALAVHYGEGPTRGTFWRDEMAQRWVINVKDANNAN